MAGSPRPGDWLVVAFVLIVAFGPVLLRIAILTVVAVAVVHYW